MKKYVKNFFCVELWYSMATTWAFDNTENIHIYCAEDCMKMFCGSLRVFATNRIILKRRKCYQRAKITPRCDKILHLLKIILKKFC